MTYITLRQCNTTIFSLYSLLYWGYFKIYCLKLFNNYYLSYYLCRFNPCIRSKSRVWMGLFWREWGSFHTFPSQSTIQYLQPHSYWQGIYCIFHWTVDKFCKVWVSILFQQIWIQTCIRCISNGEWGTYNTIIALKLVWIKVSVSY